MSGGTWTQADVGNARTRPGAYFNLIGAALAEVAPGAQGVVAIVGVSDWGPVDVVTEIGAESEADAVFDGQSLVKLVKQAFRGGAQIVKALRLAGSTKAKATASLLDDTGTPAVAAQGTLTVDTQITDSDTMTLDSKTYTFQDTLTDVDGNISIGGTLANTQQNIIDAVNLTGTPGTQYAASMTIHPTVAAATAWVVDDLILTAKTAGAAGNSIATTETFSAPTNIFDGATLGTTTAGADAVPGDPAITLDALYEGDRANDWTVDTETNPVGGVDAVLKENGVELERHNASDNDEMVDVINADSALMTATVEGTSDRGLEIQTGSAFSGGDSGLTLVAGDYTAGQSLLESEEFTAVVQDDDVTEANQDAAAAWQTTRRADGHRFFLVMGADASETVENAITRAQAQDDEGVVFVFPGFTDEDGTVFTGQEAAARVAGLIAGRGFTKSITFAEIEDAATVEDNLTGSEVQQLLEAGVCPITSDGRTIRVERGLNTFTSFEATKGKVFSKIRAVLTLDRLLDALARGLRAYVGEITNDEEGQKSILGATEGFIDQFVQARAIKPEYSVELDPANPPTSDEVFLKIGLTPLDSVEMIFATIYVSTS